MLTVRRVRRIIVSKTTNPKFWNLIHEFFQITGVPVVLNTSFNVRGEPIVCSPLDGIRCLYSTGMDALAMGDYWIEKTMPPRSVRGRGL